MCATITVACLPMLYHIFAGLNSGLITTRLPDEVELSHPKGNAYIMQSIFGGSRVREGYPGSKRRSFLGTGIFTNTDSAVITDISTSGPQGQDGRETMWRSSTSESTESTRHLTQEARPDGVLKTVNITVEVEHRPGSQGSLSTR